VHETSSALPPPCARRSAQFGGHPDKQLQKIGAALVAAPNSRDRIWFRSRTPWSMSKPRSADWRARNGARAAHWQQGLRAGRGARGARRGQAPRCKAHASRKRGVMATSGINFLTRWCWHHRWHTRYVVRCNSRTPAAAGCRQTAP
jgi:hypothetical protein